MTEYFKSGTLPVWRHPKRTRKRLGAIDSLVGTYFTERSTTLIPGDAVPDYPGMIIQDLDIVDTGVSLAYEIQAEGSLDNSLPTKTLATTEARSIGANFETITEQKLTWQSGRKACTGVASTDIITTAEPHGFSAGQRFCFLSLTGGAGLTAQSLSTIAPVYFARDITSTTFKAAATVDGSAINFTTNITAGYLMAAEFFPGTVHPLYPAMYLSTVSLAGNLSPWKIADCTYIGKMWDKPYHRTITVNGQQVSSTDKVTLPGVPDGDSDLRYRAVELPEVVVTDIYVDTEAPPTVNIPSSHSEGGTPPNPPSIRSLSLSDDTEKSVKQWPNEWSLVGTAHIETISSGISLSIYSKTYRFKFTYLPK